MQVALLVLLGALAMEPSTEERCVMNARHSIRSGEVDITIQNGEKNGIQQSRKMTLIFDNAKLRTEYHNTAAATPESRLSSQIPFGQNSHTYVMSDNGVISYSTDGTVVTVNSTDSWRMPMSFFEIRALGIIPGRFANLSDVKIDSIFMLDKRISSKWVAANSGDDKSLRKMEYEWHGGQTGVLSFSPNEGGELRKATLLSLYNGRQIRDEIEIELAKWDERVWFPKKVVFRRFNEGSEIICETTEVTRAKFNVAISPQKFKIEGLGIKPGTEIIDMRPDGEPAKVWDGSRGVPQRSSMFVDPSDRKAATGKGGFFASGLVLAGISATAAFLWLRSRHATKI